MFIVKHVVFILYKHPQTRIVTPNLLSGLPSSRAARKGRIRSRISRKMSSLGYICGHKDDRQGIDGRSRNGRPSKAGSRHSFPPQTPFNTGTLHIFRRLKLRLSSAGAGP